MRTKRVSDSEHLIMSLVDAKSALRIDKHALDEEVMKQADLFYEVSRSYASAINDRDTRKAELEEVYSTIADEFRNDPDHSGKITEQKLKELILQDADYKKANSAFLKAKFSAEEWGGMLEAFRQRNYMIREMCHLYSANYFQSASVTDTEKISNRSTRAVSRADKSEIRRRLREKRKRNV